MMDDDGSVSSKDRYNDIGKDRFVANIGHVWSEDVVNNSMVEYPLLSNLIRGDSNIPYNKTEVTSVKLVLFKSV